MSKILWALGVSGVLLWATGARASDWVYAGGGTLAQIVDGGGASSTITLVNVDSVLAPYTLSFYDDNGNPLALSTTMGTGTSLSGSLPVNGSVIVQTNGSSATTIQGYAILTTGNAVAGSLVFGLPLGSFSASSCPLDTGSDNYFGLPFDNVTSTEGIAIANSRGANPLSVTATFYDPSGTQFYSETFTLPPMGHTAFMLPSRFPQSAGRTGYVVFRGTAYFNLLGLRATGTTLTSVTPVVPQGL